MKLTPNWTSYPSLRICPCPSSPHSPQYPSTAAPQKQAFGYSSYQPFSATAVSNTTNIRASVSWSTLWSKARESFSWIAALTWCFIGCSCPRRRFRILWSLYPKGRCGIGLAQGRGRICRCWRLEWGLISGAEWSLEGPKGRTACTWTCFWWCSRVWCSCAPCHYHASTSTLTHIRRSPTTPHFTAVSARPWSYPLKNTTLTRKSCKLNCSQSILGRIA